uniref:RING-type domain-containing protein n=1 Tax=Globodera rostochiensis TaxID=31243 RepID=A0A914IF62_GLORO
MFNFFSIFLLLLIALLQIVEAIEIWVKPSNLRYTAEIICLNIDGPLTIGQATHASYFEEVGTTGYVNIGTDLSRCDDANPNVKVQIKNLDHPESLWLTKLDLPYESMEFEIPKTELLARKSAVVLGFNIAASAHKIFNFQQSSANFVFFKLPLVGYELEIVCGYMHADGMAQYYLIGSGVQKHFKNLIHIPIFEMESLAFCSRGKIGLVIHQNDRETTKYIELTTKFFGGHMEFDIDINKETVRPTPQAGSDNECLVCFDGQREMAFRPCGHVIACPFHLGQREIAFRPCGHICACRKCSKGKKKCPLCRQQIKEVFLIYS